MTIQTMLSKGFTLKIGSTAVGLLQSLSPGARTMGSAEQTHLGSSMREFRSTIGDAGEFSFTVLYDPKDATHATLEAKIESGVTETWVITGSQATAASTWTFSAFLTSFEMTVDTVDNLVLANCTAKKTGSVALVATPT